MTWASKVRFPARPRREGHLLELLLVYRVSRKKTPHLRLPRKKNPHLLGVWLKVVSVLHFCVQARYFPPPYWRKPNGVFFSGTHRISAKTQHPVCPRKKPPIFGGFFSGTDRPQIATFGGFFSGTPCSVCLVCLVCIVCFAICFSSRARTKCALEANPAPDLCSRFLGANRAPHWFCWWRGSFFPCPLYRFRESGVCAPLSCRPRTSSFPEFVRDL